jgi:hypothetical protein
MNIKIMMMINDNGRPDKPINIVTGHCSQIVLAFHAYCHDVCVTIVGERFGEWIY